MSADFETQISPEPQEKGRNTTLIIIIAAVLLLCCCTVVAVGAGIYIWNNF